MTPKPKLPAVHFKFFNAFGYSYQRKMSLLNSGKAPTSAVTARKEHLKIEESLTLKPTVKKMNHWECLERNNKRMLSATIKRPNLLHIINKKDPQLLPQVNPPGGYSSQMEALVLSTKNRDVILCQFPMPNTIRRDEVCIRVKYAAATLTDLRIIDGKVGEGAEGVIMGRELSGVVCGAGDAVQHINAGDQVVVSPCQPHAICRYCHEKNNNFCVKEKFGRLYGIERNGAWANFTIVPGNMVYKVESIEFDKASLLPHLAQVMCAVARLDIQPQKHVLIQGSGLAGILFALILRHYGHEKVTIWEDHPMRVKTLEKLGMEYTIVKDCKVTDVDVVLTCGGGADVMQQAFASLSPNGQIVVYGQAGKNGCNPRLRLTTSELSRRGVTIQGLSGTPANPSNVPSELANQLIDLNKLGVQVHLLNEHAQALTKVATGDASGVVFNLTK